MHTQAFIRIFRYKKKIEVMEDLLTFGFYPGLALFATLCLYVIADSIQKISNKK